MDLQGKELPPMPDLSGQVLEFEIEHLDEVNHDPTKRHWWAGLHHERFYAIGGGHTPWQAITECLGDIPRALLFQQTMERVHKDNVEGRCPRCGAAREPMPDPLPPGGWFCLCDKCRGVKECAACAAKPDSHCASCLHNNAAIERWSNDAIRAQESNASLFHRNETVTAERNELRRALDRVLTPPSPQPAFIERKTINLIDGSVIALASWRDVTIVFECNNSDLTQFYLRDEHIRDLAIVKDGNRMLRTQKASELLVLSANCADPDVSLDIFTNNQIRARVAGQQLLCGEPFITGPIRIRELMPFYIEANGPRHKFTVYLRALSLNPYC